MYPTAFLIASFIGRAVLLSCSLLIYQSLYSPSFHPPQPPAINISLSNTLVDVNQRAQQLAESIQFQTISGGDKSESDKSFLELHRWLRSQFPRVHNRLKWEIVNRHALLYSWTFADDTAATNILLCAHMDVVPSTESGWRYGAFDGRVEDGFIWGRGALDFKNGVVGILRAIEELLAAGFSDPPAGYAVYLAFGDDEETGGIDGAAQIAKLLAQRQLRMHLVLDEGILILCNASNINILYKVHRYRGI
jgi:carboxypeptidase PM20D1